MLVVLAGFAFAQPAMENLAIRDTLPPWNDRLFRPILARDMAPGAGIFEYASGQPAFEGYTWPRLAVGQDSRIHIAMLDSTATKLYYIRVSWPSPDTVIEIAPPQSWPGFPSHNIAASKTSGKVCITWVCDVDCPQPGFYRTSTDGGTTWQEMQQLPCPDSFGGDTVASFHTSSLFPFYDKDDELHIMAAVHPVVNDTGLVMPAAIWHWCESNTPNWSLVHRACCLPEHLLAPVGYNALYAGRPSIGEDNSGNLFAVWEEFDSSNVEPGPPPRLRADVISAWSSDCGKIWSYGYPLAEAGPGSCRFPCIVDKVRHGMPEPPHASYMLDQMAGFFVLGEGAATYNPIVVAREGNPLPMRDAIPDTVGGTTYDLQCIGPAIRTISYSPGYGVHAAWNYSSDLTREFPDLNFRYNFYDETVSSWNWIDPDFMQSGVNIYTQRTIGGNLDNDPATGVAIAIGTTPPPVGNKETQQPSAYGSRPAATILRGTLRMAYRTQGTGSRAELTSAAGQNVMELDNGPNDVSRLPSGIYFVKLDTDGGTQVRKVALQNR